MIILGISNTILDITQNFYQFLYINIFVIPVLWLVIKIEVIVFYYFTWEIFGLNKRYILFRSTIHTNKYILISNTLLILLHLT